jgi:BirA family transcriptional regulator, biotin operon repressor / biotin---[acetyl-CoA-carboxylase] ligase
VTVVDASPSTHVVLVEAVRTGDAAPGDVLVAEHQTAGRGRLDRTWTTPARAALTLSAVVVPRMPDEDWPWLPLLLGSAAVAGIRASGGPTCGLKWPNDVMHEQTPGEYAKLGGLLAERVPSPEGPRAVLSLGVNVSTTPAELPVPTATSLAEAGWRDPDRTTLLLVVLAELRTRLSTWTADAERLRREYADLCVTVGLEVRIDRPGSPPLQGRAVGVDPDGSLVLTTPAGRRRVNAGDVVHVRPRDAGGT